MYLFTEFKLNCVKLTMHLRFYLQLFSATLLNLKLSQNLNIKSQQTLHLYFFFESSDEIRILKFHQFYKF